MLLFALLVTAQSLTVRPASLTLEPGQRATLQVNAQPSQVEASDPHTILEVAPNGRSLTVQAPPYSKEVSVLIRTRDEFVVVPVRVLDPGQSKANSRLIVGLSQSGASSAQAGPHYFLDFYAKRPTNRRTSLWGNVRIASAPQQLDIPIAQFAPDFATKLGKIPVNQLAQVGEFLTGVELHATETLGLVAFFGASGAFSDPVARARVLKTGPNQYLGLIPQDRDRFYRQYGFGIRHSSPDSGTLTATVGQDQSVTAGRYHRPVFRIDTFYPLPTRRYSLYFFATATLAIAKPRGDTGPLAYEPALDVPIHDPRVTTLRTVAAARDSYRIGVGIDLIHLLHSRKARTRHSD